jgi:hypothetical protein
VVQRVHSNDNRGARRLKLGAIGTAFAVAVAGAALAAPSFGAKHGGQLIANMNGKQVVPSGEGAPNATAHGTFRVRPKRQRVCYEITFRRTQGAVRGYIFRGRRGQEPPNPNRPVVTLFGTPQSSPVAGCATAAAKKPLRRMRKKPRRFHVVLVNQKYENGAVRGQLRRP